VHRRAVNSAAAKIAQTAWQNHGGAWAMVSNCDPGRDQKIVHVRIVLGAILQ
jgi:hypothetical protein